MLPSPSPRTTKRTQAAKALPYPALPEDSSFQLFWLAAWMRSQAEYEAFRAFIDNKATRAKRDKNHTLSISLTVASRLLREDCNECIKKLHSFGGILFAWEGTTVLQQAAKEVAA